MLKHNGVRTTFQLACHGCENLAHTSKTRQVKRTQMVATARFTISVFVDFSRVCYRLQKSCEKMWVLNFPYAPIIKGSQCSRLGCTHYAFGALKVTNLGKQILMNS